MGIDPGTTRVGYGVIRKQAGVLSYIDAGLISVGNGEYLERLVRLDHNLSKTIKRFNPVICGVEKLFFTKNKKTALMVAEARGVVVSNLMRHKVQVRELTPSEVKIGVSGDGRASKDGVAKMVGYFLSISVDNLLDDVTDALAIAITASSYLPPTNKP